MSDRDNRNANETRNSLCSNRNRNICEDGDTKTNNKMKCAPMVLRRSHKVEPLKPFTENISTRSPIKYRTNPGRSFDGFLDKIVKSKVLDF